MGTLNCKAGDLAIVLRDEPGCESNIGRVVRVSGPIETNSRGDRTWLIRPVHPDGYVWLSRGSSGSRVHPYQGEDDIEHPDRWLMPLRRPEAAKRHPGARTQNTGVAVIAAVEDADTAALAQREGVKA